MGANSLSPGRSASARPAARRAAPVEVQRLRRMLADMEQAPPLYQPTRFWANAIPEIVRDLEHEGFANFRSHRSAWSYYVAHYGQQAWYRDRASCSQLEALLARMSVSADLAWVGLMSGEDEALGDHRILRAAERPGRPCLVGPSESTVGAPLEQWNFRGRRYSASFLRYAKSLALLKQSVDASGIRNVLEIGGGYGTLGEILLQGHPDHFFYLGVDIPPVAAVSTWYLQQVFGADRIAPYEQTRDLDVIDVEALRSQGFLGAILCPWQLPRVQGRFELFCNETSFQEMEPEVVMHYASCIDPLVSDFVLLKNSRHGKHVAQSEDEVGVEAPIKRDDYLRWFPDFELRALDADVFGQVVKGSGFESEVMVLERRRG